MALSKDQIFGATDSDVIEIAIPEWGGSVKLKPMTGTSVSIEDADGTDSISFRIKDPVTGAPELYLRLAVERHN